MRPTTWLTIAGGSLSRDSPRPSVVSSSNAKPHLSSSLSTKTLVFLKTKVKSVRKAAKGKADTAASLQAQATDAAAQLERQRKKAREMEAQQLERHAASQRVSAELVQKTTARNNLAEERKERWRVLEGLQVGLCAGFLLSWYL